MTIRTDALLAHNFGEQRQAYTARDVILYALGLGLGGESTHLDYLDETRLSVVPTFAATLASPGMWIQAPEFGIDFSRLVHIAQNAVFPNHLPSSGDVIGTANVVSITDRGAGRGALLVLERRVRDAFNDRPYAVIQQTLLLRGDGGFGGAPPRRATAMVPNRGPDLHVQVTLSSRAALIYRLSGDRNPLHIDPDAARAAGFDRPIMHGLGTYGTAGIAVAHAVGRSPAAISRLSCRFTGVVYPGDTLSIDVWDHPTGAIFAAHVEGRKVLDDAKMEFGS